MKRYPLPSPKAHSSGLSRWDWLTHQLSTLPWSARGLALEGQLPAEREN